MNLLNSLGSAMGGGKTPTLMAALLPLLQKAGGLDGLKKMFDGAGLGNIIQSWISTESNLPISADQVSSVLGGANGLLGSAAKEAGMAPDAAATELASSLPSLVDTLSPGGSLPTGDLMDMAKSALGGGALGKLLG
jgi:uncharacterized protein YidB (DUF937 family)